MRTELSDKIREFLGEVRFGVLATVGPDGSPHQTVMWYVLDGDEVLLNTARGRVKPDNLSHDPRVSLMVEDAYRYVRLTGRAREITDHGTTQGDIRRLAVRYEGEEAAERMVRSSFSKQERISYRFRVARVYASSNFA